MIDTFNRDPKQTEGDLTAVMGDAVTNRYTPLRFEIGFFQARDLLDLRVPGWRQSGKYASWFHLGGVPCVVSQLEDRVSLVCRAPSGAIKTFAIDRRGGD